MRLLNDFETSREVKRGIRINGEPPDVDERYWAMLMHRREQNVDHGGVRCAIRCERSWECPFGSKIS
jgi:hypothetical protein